MIIPDNLESLYFFSKIGQNFHVEIDSQSWRFGLAEKSQKSSSEQGFTKGFAKAFTK